MNTAPQGLTAEALADLETPSNIQVSPSGSQVVYTLSTKFRKEKHQLSSLWLAEVGKEHSARQLTAGQFNDDKPQWSPDGENIAFISDRDKQGETSAIYILSLKGGEAYPVTKADNKRTISSFAWSPDGRFIAFLSPDEKTAEQEKKEADKDDPKVYGEDWEYTRLRSLHVQTRELTTLYSQDDHINEFTWSEDSKKIAHVVQQTPDINSAGYHGISFKETTLATKNTVTICEFPGSVANLVWSGENFFFLGGVAPKNSNTSRAVYKINLQAKSWEKHSLGESNCAGGLFRMKSSVAVKVLSGLADQIHVLDGKTVYDDLHEISSWHMVSTADEGQVLAITKSSADSPPEVYSVVDGKSTKLSQHGQAIAKLQVATSKPFYCTAKDGTELDGVLLTPTKTDKPKPWPTLVAIHGGPYHRVSVGFNTPHHYLGPWLASAGYAVLLPNYRGGSSRGEKYASNARGGMGTQDYEDVIALLKAGIAEGTIDEDRVVVGGWSQGGFLSYLAVTRPDFQFKGAICGAGVSDWDMMCMTSDAPFFEAELAGKAPWVSDPTDTAARQGSAIWNMKNVKTPILILHGEEDERVPVTQARAFHRGCLHYGVPCEMVVYPREGHSPKERAHYLDIMRRVMRFCDTHLKE